MVPLHDFAAGPQELGPASLRGLAVDPAERAINQAPPHLSLTLIEAPVGEMLEDEHPQHDGGGRPQSAPAPTLGMTPRNLSIGMSRHGPLAHPRSMKISYHSPAAARA